MIDPNMFYSVSYLLDMMEFTEADRNLFVDRMLEKKDDGNNKYRYVRFGDMLFVEGSVAILILKGADMPKLGVA